MNRTQELYLKEKYQELAETNPESHWSSQDYYYWGLAVKRSHRQQPIQTISCLPLRQIVLGLKATPSSTKKFLIPLFESWKAETPFETGLQHYALGWLWHELGDFQKSLEYQFQGLIFFRDSDLYLAHWIQYDIVNNLSSLGRLQEALKLNEELKNSPFLPVKSFADDINLVLHFKLHDWKYLWKNRSQEKAKNYLGILLALNGKTTWPRKFYLSSHQASAMKSILGNILFLQGHISLPVPFVPKELAFSNIANAIARLATAIQMPTTQNLVRLGEIQFNNEWENHFFRKIISLKAIPSRELPIIDVKEKLFLCHQGKTFQANGLFQDLLMALIQSGGAPVPLQNLSAGMLETFDQIESLSKRLRKIRADVLEKLDIDIHLNKTHIWTDIQTTPEAKQWAIKNALGILTDTEVSRQNIEKKLSISRSDAWRLLKAGQLLGLINIQSQGSKTTYQIGRVK